LLVIGFLTRSIPRRTLAALLSICLVTYLATAVVVYSGVRESMLDSDAIALNQLADLKYAQLVNVVGALATDLTAWSELDVMNDLVSGDLDKRVTQTLESLKRLYHLPGDIYAFDSDGKLIASSRSGRNGAENDRIPPQWQNREKSLAPVDKEKDPMTGDDVVALEIPIFGNFDKTYRIGTLVMTYSWASIEKLLFSVENGTILLAKSGPMRILAANPAGIAERTGFGRAGPQDSGRNVGFVVGRSAPREGLINNWQVVTFQESDAATRPLRQVTLELVLLGTFLGIPILFLGRWLSDRLTAPIADLTRVVREIADTDKLDARVPVASPDELGSLARSFNRMTDNLERTTREREQFVSDLAALNQTLEAKIAARTEEVEAAMKAQQRLIGDISHEIKSPLARLSIALGLARRSAKSDAPKQFDRMEGEIENISALASELLTLARLDATAAPPAFAEINLGALVKQIVMDARYEKPRRRSDVIFRNIREPITVVGNVDLLRRGIENVVRNAIFYTTEKTAVEIILSRKEPEIVSIEVWDQGPGVPETALAHLFEPFYRVDEARARETGGTGIGLAICERVIRLHGGAVRARNNEPHGLIVEIDLPCASTPIIVDNLTSFGQAESSGA
jgi:signal transduction histidine kinase